MFVYLWRKKRREMGLGPVAEVDLKDARAAERVLAVAVLPSTFTFTFIFTLTSPPVRRRYPGALKPRHSAAAVCRLWTRPKLSPVRKHS